MKKRDLGKRAVSQRRVTFQKEPEFAEPLPVIRDDSQLGAKKRKAKKKMEAPKKAQKKVVAKEAEDDNESMENNTNLNWETGEYKTELKRKKAGGVEAAISEYSIIKTEKQSINLQCQQTARNYQLNSADFYEASHYYIDTLKDEFCYSREDGWFEMKEVFTMQSYQNKLLDDSDDVVKIGQTPHTQFKPEDKEYNPKIRTGKWTEQEHQLFLQSLRLNGKDWKLAEKMILTRNQKGIISHAQKFLIRLLKFLDGKEAIDDMTMPMAEYFYGVLTHKVHWTQKRKMEQEQERADNWAAGKIFRVDKVERPKQAEVAQEPEGPSKQDETMSSKEDSRDKESSKESSQSLEEKDATLSQCLPDTSELSQYDRWRVSRRGGAGTSYKSLGQSVATRVLPFDKKSGLRQFKLSFKSVLDYNYGDGDDDSAASQSSRHMRKFYVDDGYQMLKDEESFQQLQEAMSKAFMQLPDIANPDVENIKVMWKFGQNGPEFDVFSDQPASEVLSKLYRMDQEEEYMCSHPNLMKFIKRKMVSKMDDEGLNEQDRSFPLYDFLFSRTPEQLQEIVAEGIKFFYKMEPPHVIPGLGKQDSAMPAELKRPVMSDLDLQKMDLDMCTNFKH